MKTILKMIFVSSALLVFSACKNETTTGSGTSEGSVKSDVQTKKQGQAFIENDESAAKVL